MSNSSTASETRFLGEEDPHAAWIDGVLQV
jgi:hypothetical protein